MAIHESAWGTSQIANDKKNLFGYGSYDATPYESSYEFTDYKDGIELVAKVMVKYYINPVGTKIYDNEKALATYSKKMGIDRYIRLGHGQMNNLNDTIIADVFEAVAAAVYLDQGYEVIKKYLQDIIVPFIKEGWDFNTDYKTKLQEAVQTNKKSLEYVLIREYGEAHDKTFEMAVKIDNIIYGKGIGKSKKEAEQNAALDALNKSVVK